MVKCLHCGSFNQDTPDERTGRCWKCQGTLPLQNKKVYIRPTIIVLRLEKKVADDAAKWWKVEEFLTKQAKEAIPAELSVEFREGVLAGKAYALRDFIVQLTKEG